MGEERGRKRAPGPGLGCRVRHRRKNQRNAGRGDGEIIGPPAESERPKLHFLQPLQISTLVRHSLVVIGQRWETGKQLGPILETTALIPFVLSSLGRRAAGYLAGLQGYSLSSLCYQDGTDHSHPRGSPLFPIFMLCDSSVTQLCHSARPAGLQLGPKDRPDVVPGVIFSTDHQISYSHIVDRPEANTSGQQTSFSFSLVSSHCQIVKMALAVVSTFRSHVCAFGRQRLATLMKRPGGAERGAAFCPQCPHGRS